jgi:hypothetical protein
MPRTRPTLLIGAFAVLFSVYQLPEGLGDHLLHSFPVKAALMLLFLPVAWAVGRGLGWGGFRAYALELRPGWWRALLVLFAVAVLAKAAAMVAGVAAGAALVSWEPGPPGALLPAIPFGLLATFVPSIAEDIVTRGFWYRAVPVRWSGTGFVLATSLIYVLNHVYRLGKGPLEWLLLGCFGVAYAAAAWRARSLWGAVGLHWGWNFGNALADAVTRTEAVAPARGSLISAGTHLLLAGLVLALPGLGAPRSPPPSTPPSA